MADKEQAMLKTLIDQYGQKGLIALTLFLVLAFFAVETHVFLMPAFTGYLATSEAVMKDTSSSISTMDKTVAAMQQSTAAGQMQRDAMMRSLETLQAALAQRHTEHELQTEYLESHEAQLSALCESIKQLTQSVPLNSQREIQALEEMNDAIQTLTEEIRRERASN